VLSAERLDRLRLEFRSCTGRPAAGVWSAPGRANLIGEHLDYNGGLVLPYALGLRTAVAVATRDDGRIRCWSLQHDQATDVSLAEIDDVTGWSAYLVGTVWAMREAGVAVAGFDVVVDGEVPMGAGLSSSAALECAVALAVNDLCDAGLDRLQLARAGQRAENDVVGAPVGIMDQLAALLGQDDHAVLLDCATLESTLVPLPLRETGTQLLVIDSGIRHDLADGSYADRRRSCEAAADLLGVDHLALVAPERLGEIDDELTRRRARHVVTDQQRVHEVVNALARQDMTAVGAALTQSHASLRDDFEISVPELDGAVEAAIDAGALGARLIGGGFGGCVLALTPDTEMDAVFAAVSRRAAEQGWPKPGRYDGQPRGGARREDPMPATITNWAGNLTFSAARIQRPSSVEELQQLVADSECIRALGSGHSFSPVAGTTGDLVSLAELPRVLRIDEAHSTVTVGAAIRYGDLAQALHARGYALRNLASLPHITVAGGCATATHGSGDANGNLTTAVRSMQLVGADGGIVEISPALDPDRFAATAVGLGALGIVTALTLEIVPTYDVRQFVYEDLSYRVFRGHVDDILGGAYSVSLFTDCRESRFTQVWRKHRVGDDDDAPSSLMGAALADGPRHPVPGMDPVHCTAQGGVPGPWHERLPHFRLEFVPSSGRELQSEYLIPRGLAGSALEALDAIRSRIAPVLQVCELRTVAADRLWLSPSYERDTVGVHFTWIDDLPAVAPVIAAVERQLEPYDARPHWGKLFTMAPDRVARHYDRLPDFRAMRARHDPDGKFGNPFVDRYLSGS
jgi:alditol oxidase